MMESGEIFARLTEMRESAAQIGRSAAQIGECMQNVDVEVQSLSQDRFMSAGAESFRAEYYRQTPRLREALDQLLRFQDKLRSSADEIEAASRLIQKS